MVPDKNANPFELRLLTQSKELEVHWDDGAISRYTFQLLRRACRCAECKSQGKLSLPNADDVALEEIVPVGQNAVQLCFDDGHRRGIYPFSYLRELGKL